MSPIAHNLASLFRRDHDDHEDSSELDLDISGSDGLTPTMIGLLIALICLVIVGTGCIFALLLLRRIRRRREAAAGGALPSYHSSQASLSIGGNGGGNGNGGGRRGHRRTLTITSAPNMPPQVAYADSNGSVVDEKAALHREMQMQNQNQQNNNGRGSVVPEIHITFPEEQGEKRGSRVVVVQISDNGGVGLEPYRGGVNGQGQQMQQQQEEEQLPRYERTDSRGEWRSLDLERLGGLKEGGRREEMGEDKRWG